MTLLKYQFSWMGVDGVPCHMRAHLAILLSWLYRSKDLCNPRNIQLLFVLTKLDRWPKVENRKGASEMKVKACHCVYKIIIASVCHWTIHTRITNTDWWRTKNQTTAACTAVYWWMEILPIWSAQLLCQPVKLALLMISQKMVLTAQLRPDREKGHW